MKCIDFDILTEYLSDSANRMIVEELQVSAIQPIQIKIRKCLRFSKDCSLTTSMYATSFSN